jgi:two-component system cell cycle response regulator DivK
LLRYHPRTLARCLVFRNPQNIGSMEAGESSRSTAKRILIVEDNELNMKLLNDVLEAYGYEIIASHSGASALDLARQRLPHLILMDIQLPDMSGLEAARRLKGDEQTRAIPIIAVTAFAMAGDERKTLDSGCDAYVAKPIMLREFLEIVEKFIGPAAPES